MKKHTKHAIPLSASVVALLAATMLAGVALPALADPTNTAATTVDASPIAGAGDVKFVPNLTPLSCSGTLEMLKSAEIPGKQIRIRQVVRWSQEDSASFSAIADLVIDRFDTEGTRRLTVDEIRATLTGAGVNMGLVQFSGARSCLLSHKIGVEPTPEVTPTTDDRAMVRQWIEQKNKVAQEAAPTVSVDSPPDDAVGTITPFHTLRDRVLLDLSQRLNLPVDQLQLTFDPKDRTILNLTEANNLFHFTPRRMGDLGRVSWEVTITTGEKQRTFELVADARAWQKQIVMEKSAAYKQVIRDEDISEKRVLVDHLTEDPLLTRAQIVGQQAARDLKPGTVLTGRLIDPLPLARQGQTVTVILNQGGIRIRTAAIAMESGCFGQTIKVQNEQTKDVFEVTLTGPQFATIGPASPESAVASVKE